MHTIHIVFQLTVVSSKKTLNVYTTPGFMYRWTSRITGTLIEQKLRENTLALPPSDEVTFTHFDNQVISFIASKATSEMPNRELVIRVIKFDGTDDAEMPSDRTLEMGTSVDLDSLKKSTLTTPAIAFETFKEQHVNQTPSSIVKYTNEGYGTCKGLLKVLSYGFAIAAALLSLVMMGVQFFYHRLAEPHLKNLIGRQK